MADRRLLAVRLFTMAAYVRPAQDWYPPFPSPSSLNPCSTESPERCRHDTLTSPSTYQDA